MNNCLITVDDMRTCSAVISALKTMRKMAKSDKDQDILTFAVEALIAVRDKLPDALLMESADGYAIVHESFTIMKFVRAAE